MDDFDSEGLDVFQSTSVNTYLEPCSCCGRKFQPESLQKHYPICKKNSMKKRKAFDSTKQRVAGTDISLAKARAATKEPESPAVSSKKQAWKQKHEEFVSTIRAARGVTAALKSGAPLPPPPPPSINPDYVQCQYCSRRFNSTAAERHIPFCKEQQQRLTNKKPKVVDATVKARSAARLQYKAPRPKLKSESSPSTSRQEGNNGAIRTRQSTSDNKTNNATTRPGSGRYSASSGNRGQQKTSMSAGSTGRQNASAGYDPYTSAESQMNNLRKTASGARTNTKKYQSNMYSDDEDGLESNYGAPMRTGRTQENYDEGKRMQNGPRDRMQQRKTKFTKRDSYDTLHVRGSPNDIFAHDSRDGYTPSPPASGRPPSGSNVMRHRPMHQLKHEAESGYHSNSDGEQLHNTTQKRKGSAAKFCHDCGTRYPVDWAKFCCECGIKRMYIS